MVRIEENGQAALDQILNGIDPRSTSKLEDLKALRGRTLPLLEHFGRWLKKATGSRIEIDAKSDASLLAKAARPSTIARRPAYGLEHVRDALRFRSSVRSLDEFVASLRIFFEAAGSGSISLVKIDHEKFFRPNPFGWRMIACDLRFLQTGMIVEHYMTFSDVILVNDLLLHQIFRNWRNRSNDLTVAELRQRSAEISVCASTNYAWFVRSLSIDKGRIIHEAGARSSVTRATHAVAAARDRYDAQIEAALAVFREQIERLIRAYVQA